MRMAAAFWPTNEKHSHPLLPELRAAQIIGMALRTISYEEKGERA